ncbi:hypothetical protein D9M72_602830 [compost metagenome]
MIEVLRFSATKRRSASSYESSGNSPCTKTRTPSVRVDPGTTALTVTAVPLVSSAKVRDTASVIDFEAL